MKGYFLTFMGRCLITASRLSYGNPLSNILFTVSFTTDLSKLNSSARRRIIWWIWSSATREVRWDGTEINDDVCHDDLCTSSILTNLSRLILLRHDCSFLGSSSRRSRGGHGRPKTSNDVLFVIVSSRVRTDRFIIVIIVVLSFNFLFLRLLLVCLLLRFLCTA